MSHPLNLRRAGAKRIPGGDPWPMEYAPVPLTEHQLHMWRETVTHLRREGFMAIVADPELAALLGCATGVADE